MKEKLEELTKAVNAYATERTKHFTKQRRSARLRLLFTLFIGLIVASAYLYPLAKSRWVKQQDHIAVVVMKGQIGKDISDDEINGLLRHAFESKHSKAVMLRINSPGGSAAASTSIRGQLDDMMAEYPDKPVYVVAGDALASGAYLIASGADYICAQPATMVGSVGVIMQSFVLKEALDKLGIEPQVFHAGENKTRLSFLEKASEDDKAKFTEILEAIHQDFIGHVERGRGEKINADFNLWTGDFWVSPQSIKYGLIDGICTVRQAAKKIELELGLEELPLVLYQPRFSLQDLKLGLSLNLQTQGAELSIE